MFALLIALFSHSSRSCIPNETEATFLLKDDSSTLGSLEEKVSSLEESCRDKECGKQGLASMYDFSSDPLSVEAALHKDSRKTGSLFLSVKVSDSEANATIALANIAGLINPETRFSTIAKAEDSLGEENPVVANLATSLARCIPSVDAFVAMIDKFAQVRTLRLECQLCF